MMPLRRWIQLASLILFLLLLGMAVSGSAVRGLDVFLRLDPALVLITALSARTWVAAFVPLLVVLAATLLWGRLFCGYVCPMGTTLDGVDRLAAGSRRFRPGWVSARLKYLLLIFLAGAALWGVSLVFLATPLALITRLYGLLVYPVLASTADKGLSVLRPLADHMDWRALVYADIRTPRFATQMFVLLFFTGLGACAWLTPRFWCRYLCPSGALFGLAGCKPLVRRQVDEACTHCGKCVRHCPMAAIHADDPAQTRYEACIACRTCQHVCPERAVSFKAAGWTAALRRPVPDADRLWSRRQFMGAGLAGLGGGAVLLTGLQSVYPENGEGRVLAPGLIRPPGALPEKELLARCVRCGECVAACPTNTLQPLWLQAGFIGLFSPAVTPRRGFCDPRCRRCSQVCPTGAIREVPADDRIWVKTGTAYIMRRRCLAWEFHKSCMVCDEVCPYDAVQFKYETGNPFAVPHVNEDRCAGCGYCEYHCPVQHQAAIVVRPMGELRLTGGSFEQTARRRGYILQLKAPAQGREAGGASNSPAAAKGAAPGFDVDDR
jgi:ferredoxin